jgi:hypothetical protein
MERNVTCEDDDIRIDRFGPPRATSSEFEVEVGEKMKLHGRYSEATL